MVGVFSKENYSNRCTVANYKILFFCMLSMQLGTSLHAMISPREFTAIQPSLDIAAVTAVGLYSEREATRAAKIMPALGEMWQRLQNKLIQLNMALMSKDLQYASVSSLQMRYEFYELQLRIWQGFFEQYRKPKTLLGLLQEACHELDALSSRLNSWAMQQSVRFTCPSENLRDALAEWQDSLASAFRSHGLVKYDVLVPYAASLKIQTMYLEHGLQEKALSSEMVDAAIEALDVIKDAYRQVYATGTLEDREYFFDMLAIEPRQFYTTSPIVINMLRRPVNESRTLLEPACNFLLITNLAVCLGLNEKELQDAAWQKALECWNSMNEAILLFSAQRDEQLVLGSQQYAKISQRIGDSYRCCLEELNKLRPTPHRIEVIATTMCKHITEKLIPVLTQVAQEEPQLFVTTNQLLVPFLQKLLQEFTEWSKTEYVLPYKCLAYYCKALKVQSLYIETSLKNVEIPAADIFSNQVALDKTINKLCRARLKLAKLLTPA